ncbi:hypothetical protein D3C81_2059730 [compost metagenome]
MAFEVCDGIAAKRDIRCCVGERLEDISGSPATNILGGQRWVGSCPDPFVQILSCSMVIVVEPFNDQDVVGCKRAVQ